MAIIAVLVLITCITAFCFIWLADHPSRVSVAEPGETPPGSGGEIWHALRAFAVGAIPSAAVVVIAWLVGSYWLGKHGLSSTHRLGRFFSTSIGSAMKSLQQPSGVVEVTAQYFSIPWGELVFNDARHVYIVAQFYDRILDYQRGHALSLVNGGGHLSFVLPHPECDSIVERYSAARGCDVGERILNTVDEINLLIKQTNNPQFISLHLAREPINYCAWVSAGRSVLWNPIELSFDDNKPFPFSFADVESAEASVVSIQEDVERFIRHHTDPVSLPVDTTSGIWKSRAGAPTSQ